MKVMPLLFLPALAACGVVPGLTASRPIASTTGEVAKTEGADLRSRQVEPQEVEPGVILKPMSFESGRKFEVVEVWVDQTQPNAQRKLVPYLLKSDEWTLVKCEHLSVTRKLYKFQRLVTSEKKPPEIDPLNPPPSIKKAPARN